MKMTKMITLAAALMTGSIFASDFQYLYWMVDISDQAGTNPEYAFSYATVSAGGNVFTLYDNDQNPSGTHFGIDGDASSGFTAGLQSAGGDPIYAGDISGYIGSTFLFELFDENDNKVAWKSVAWSAIENYVGGTMSTISNPYVVSQVVPEPTSGFLLLLGMAGLALKRKRA